MAKGDSGNPPPIAEQRLSFQIIWWAVPTLHFGVNDRLLSVVDKIHSYGTAFDVISGVASE